MKQFTGDGDKFEFYKQFISFFFCALKFKINR